MDDNLAARIATLEQHIDRLYSMLGQAGPYAVAAATPAGYAAPPAYPPSAGMPAPQTLVSSGVSVPESVMAYIRQGQDIRAIKQYRQETGSGLKDAKTAVDAAVKAYRQGRIR